MKDEGKIAVITGASRGLGLTLAKEFAANGWHVAGIGRSEKPTELPANAQYHQLDAGDADAAATFWQKLHDEHPDVQVCLVNNAGGYVSGSLLDTTPADFEQQMRSCYFTSVYMMRGLVQAYATAKIINVVSNSALAAHKNNAAYGAAKAAQMHFFQALQKELKPEQYQITNLYPSDIATHGPNPGAIKPEDLATFIRQQAESQTTYYLRDVTMYPN